MGRLQYFPSWVWFVGILPLAAGCQSHSSVVSERASVEAQAPLPRVSEKLLQQYGLETLWYNEPRDRKVDGGVHLAELEGDSLFVATTPRAGKTGQLKRLLRANGHTLWYLPLDESLAHAPVVYEYPPGTDGKPGEVYLSQLDTVYCVDLRYGDILWKEQVGFAVSTRVVANEEMYFSGSETGVAYGLPKRSPSEVWTYRTGSVIQASPVVGGPHLYVGSTDGALHRLTARQGFIQGVTWKLDTGARIVSDPVVFSRWVIVGSTDYKVYCLESQDGSRRWDFSAEAPVEDTPVVYSHAANQEYVYAIGVERSVRGHGANRTLFSVKLSTGQEQWRVKNVRKVVSMGKRLLYVLDDKEKKMRALDVLTGRELFTFPLGGFSFVPTNLADNGRDRKERGRIYLIGEDGTIQVIGERL